MRRFLPALFFLLLSILIILQLRNSPVKNTFAAPATHIVISEIQIAGIASGNDFIELYNPTTSDINLEGLRLAKRTSGTTSASIVAFASDETITAHGYYLWCNTSLNVNLSCDRNTSATVSDNNSVALLNGPLATGTVVDAVSFGSLGSPFGEGVSLIAPTASSSVERKANSSSTPTSMEPGGTDELAGNAEDTGNNSSDFVSRVSSQPQNSQSVAEPVPTPTDSTTPTVSPTETPSVTTTPSITENPTPTESITPSLSPNPTPSLSPTPTPRIITRGPIFNCSINYRSWRFFNRQFFFPFIQCMRT